ncbi:hypothetical protein B0H16DRAFT_1823765 [Mycena metata]|uniref:F-box domain-containing protein n=1 Tax=Mycena metata TaxID=1033252 RepID=A0AAD7J8L6_9AGAR|nr:hypothetical protein B0H16DRAFT_1823765 [Mycena metata]
MNAPHLRRVELGAGWNPPNSISIPWPQLTHLTLVAPPFAGVAVLAKCSNLVSADLSEMYTFGLDDTALTTATLTHLTSLSLTISSALIQAVGNLDLPALTTLSFNYRRTGMIWPHLAVFHQLPLHTIQYLSFELNNDPTLELTTLYALLRCTPNVISLRLKSTCISNALVSALRTDVPPSDVLLPRLEAFWMEWATLGDYFDLENLKAMLSSRVGLGLLMYPKSSDDLYNTFKSAVAAIRSAIP